MIVMPLTQGELFFYILNPPVLILKFFVKYFSIILSAPKERNISAQGVPWETMFRLNAMPFGLTIVSL